MEEVLVFDHNNGRAFDGAGIILTSINYETVLVLNGISWSDPGGYIDIKDLEEPDPLFQCAIRECMEETRGVIDYWKLKKDNSIIDTFYLDKMNIRTNKWYRCFYLIINKLPPEYVLQYDFHSSNIFEDEGLRNETTDIRIFPVDKSFLLEEHPEFLDIRGRTRPFLKSLFSQMKFHFHTDV